MPEQTNYGEEERRKRNHLINPLNASPTTHQLIAGVSMEEGGRGEEGDERGAMKGTEERKGAAG